VYNIFGILRKMNRKDLRHQAGISTASIAKPGKGQNITTDILLKICEALNCDFSDIMEIDKSSVEDDHYFDLQFCRTATGNQKI
jgi:DNA-binding Xre family transcriptional regulator